MSLRFVALFAVAISAAHAAPKYRGIRAKMRVSPVTQEKCDELKQTDKCYGVVLDFIHPKCKGPTAGFSTGVNLILAIDGQKMKQPTEFYSAMRVEGPHSIKLYWVETEAGSAAFQSGMKTVRFDLAQCK